METSFEKTSQKIEKRILTVLSHSMNNLTEEIEEYKLQTDKILKIAEEYRSKVKEDISELTVPIIQKDVSHLKEEENSLS